MRNRCAWVIAVLAMAIIITAGTWPASAQTPSVLVEWNRLLQGLLDAGPSSAQRSLAMLHVAMFDAINAIEDAYAPYHHRVRARRGASAEAAAAQAAHDVVTALFPSARSTLDAALAARLKTISAGPARDGAEVGRQVAQAVLRWRQDDGWPASIGADAAFPLAQLPGFWAPTPPANSNPLFTFYADVKPFALLTSTQYLPPAPPPLTSPRYAQDFNEVKRLGEANSTARTAEETLMSQLFAGVNTSTGFLHVWNNVAAEAATRQRLSLVQAARLFALVNVSLHDGLQTSFTSKFVYRLWRPVTAIRRANEDGNDATVADPNWTPLLATPPYPTYAGNAACLSAAAARALQLAIGRDDVAFSVTWTRTMGLPSVTREYAGFRQLADQQAWSRVLGGIHFPFDSEASQAACPRVAEYAHVTFMQPKGRFVTRASTSPER